MRRVHWRPPSLQCRLSGCGGGSTDWVWCTPSALVCRVLCVISMCVHLHLSGQSMRVYGSGSIICDQLHVHRRYNSTSVPCVLTCHVRSVHGAVHMRSRAVLGRADGDLRDAMTMLLRGTDSQHLTAVCCVAVANSSTVCTFFYERSVSTAVWS